MRYNYYNSYYIQALIKQRNKTNGSTQSCIFDPSSKHQTLDVPFTRRHMHTSDTDTHVHMRNRTATYMKKKLDINELLIHWKTINIKYPHLQHSFWYFHFYPNYIYYLIFTFQVIGYFAGWAHATSCELPASFFLRLSTSMPRCIVLSIALLNIRLLYFKITVFLIKLFFSSKTSRIW